MEQTLGLFEGRKVDAPQLRVSGAADERVGKLAMHEVVYFVGKATVSPAMAELTLKTLTDAQYRGLLAFDDSGFARESNATDLDKHYVYWQTVRALAGAGLVGLDSNVYGGMHYQLTKKGQEWVAELREETGEDDPDDDYIPFSYLPNPGDVL